MHLSRRLFSTALISSLAIGCINKVQANDLIAANNGILDVDGPTASFGTNASVANTPGYSITYFDDATATVSFSATRSQSLWKWFNSGATNPGVVIDASGKLGVGISPAMPLDVSGSARISGSLTVNGSTIVTGPVTVSGSQVATTGANQTFTGTNTFTGQTNLGGNTTENQVRIKTSGSVGIGTDNTAAINGTDPEVKLAVNGSLKLDGKLMMQSLTSTKLFVRGGAHPGYSRRIVWAGNDLGFYDVAVSSPPPAIPTRFEKNNGGLPSHQRGLCLLQINRKTLALVKAITYDVYQEESEQNAMASALAGCFEDSFVVIASAGAWRSNDALKAQLLRAGASPAVLSTDGEKSYVLVGIPGIGAGNGQEAWNEENFANSPIGANLVVDLVRPPDLYWDISDAARSYEIAGRKDNTLLKNDGSVAFHTDVAVKNRKVIRVSAAGDIPMIANPAGLNPEY